MKTTTLFICYTAILFIFLVNGKASANLVLVEFTGTVNQVPSVLSPTIFSNDLIKGSITYNTNAMPQKKMFDDPDTIARYWNSYTQVALRIGSFELGVPNGAQVDELGVLNVQNDFITSGGELTDALLFQVGNVRNSNRQHTLFNAAPLINGYHLENFMFGFFNQDGTALNSLAPPSEFDPNKFMSYGTQFTFSTGTGEFERGIDLDVIFGSASITRVEVIAQTPLPAAVWLMGSGLLGLMGFSRKNKAQAIAA